MIAEPIVSVPIVKPFHVSSTRISDYLACPTYYRLRHIDKVSMPATEAMIAGREFHEWAQAKSEGRPPAPFVEPALAKGWDALQSITADPTATEGTLTATWLDGEQPVELIAKLDWYRLEGERVRIIDYKSGRGALWTAPSPTGLLEDVQAQSYAFAAFTEHPWVNEVYFALALPRFEGRMVAAVISREVNAAWVEGFLKRVVHRMLTDTRFAPNPNCEKCPPGAHVRASDPYRQLTVTVGKVQVIGKDGRILKADKDGFDIELGPIENQAQAADAARWSVLFSDLATALERQCKGWAEGHGPIRVGSKELGYHYQPKRAFGDPAKAAELCQKLKLPLAPNLTALTPYLHGKKAIPELQALLVETPGTSFGWKEATPIPLSNASDSTGVTVAFPPSSPAVPPATPEPGSTISAPAPSLTADEAAGGPLTPPRVDSSPASPIAAAQTAGTEGESRPGSSLDWNVASVILRLRQAARKSKARTARNALPTLAGIYTDRWALVKAVFPEATIMAELSPGQAAALVEWSQTAGFDKESALVEGSL